jgi:hypothetical protein
VRAPARLTGLHARANRRSLKGNRWSRRSSVFRRIRQRSRGGIAGRAREQIIRVFPRSVTYQAAAVAFAAVRALAQLAPSAYFTMGSVLLPLDLVRPRCPVDQVRYQPQRFFRTTVVSRHHTECAAYGRIDALMVYPELVERRRNIPRIVSGEPDALYLPVGRHGDPR